MIAAEEVVEARTAARVAAIEDAAAAAVDHKGRQGSIAHAAAIAAELLARQREEHKREAIRAKEERERMLLARPSLARSRPESPSSSLRSSSPHASVGRRSSALSGYDGVLSCSSARRASRAQAAGRRT